MYTDQSSLLMFQRTFPHCLELNRKFCASTAQSAHTSLSRNSSNILKTISECIRIAYRVLKRQEIPRHINIIQLP